MLANNPLGVLLSYTENSMHASFVFRRNNEVSLAFSTYAIVSTGIAIRNLCYDPHALI